MLGEKSAKAILKGEPSHRGRDPKLTKERQLEATVNAD